MNNNRYNLRSSSGQQQGAPSLYPTSSTTATMTFNNGSSAFTTSTTTTTGIPSSMLSTSNISQTALQAGQHPQQFPQQPAPHFGDVRQQQQQKQWASEAQVGLGASTEPDQHQHQQQQFQHQQAQAQNLGMGGPAATAPFLQDFTLVAEAVKRVQMDAVMTEMESITL